MNKTLEDQRRCSRDDRVRLPGAVADGVEVLPALQIRPYDLVFMDIRMPEMDGFAAAKQIDKVVPNSSTSLDSLQQAVCR